MIFITTLLTSCLKLILIPAYRSTDFEVHRNWLAVTHSLPVNKWYIDNTSEWTLDYPPLFAWFEYVLSLLAVDKDMLNINNLNYSSQKAVLFQRLSVIFTDLVYSYGTFKICKSLPKNWRTDVVLPILLIANCGLIMLDHIHFQYNGLMYGILLISIAEMFRENHLMSAFWFTILLNMKHIYIYLAPAYFIYLLKNYCLNGSINFKNISSEQWLKTLKLGSVVIGIFLITFLPFHDHLPQVLSRLFPFKRGLCHAYWAPNIWALYNTIDKISYIILRKFGFNIVHEHAAMTGGLVQQYSHSILPSITPLTTIILTVIMMLPCMMKLWTLRRCTDFLRCVVLCAFTSFLFGWHVHEKAILMAVIPLTVLSVVETFDAKIFLILSIVGHYSLFPLLFPSSLLIIKLLLLIIYATYTFHSLSKMYTLSICKCSLPMLNFLESLYILGLGCVFMYENFIHHLMPFGKTLPFMPLMITSVYCSLGIVYCWLTYYINFLMRTDNEHSKRVKKKISFYYMLKEFQLKIPKLSGSLSTTGHE